MPGISLSSDRWPLIESLFERASDLPEAERDAFLDRECGHDEQMRQEVEALLRADRAADGILDRPLERAAGAVLATPSGPADAPPAGALPPGTLIDVYRIVRELGHGGMGAVYLAERADGAYSQQVALKVVRGGLIAAALERRFLRERQILARLQHPNIARLLDGGFTRERLPYLAMEYVEGEPLTRWAESRSLGAEARLRLFLEVCEAVQYAHRQLVVHRDLKPANILVSGEGHVRLLDFGIARLLDDSAEEGEALTRTGFLLLTPEYAAPEQVRGDAPTTATDVYSLGAVLYELLSGKKAYEFSSHSLTEILRVLDQDIPLLAHRPDLPKALQRQLSGDLETIVHRALAREPERRYPSAEALAADVRRHLEHRPVAARPDSLGYRLAKYLRRNRLAVSAAAALLIAIALGVATTIWQALEARREATRAQAMSDLLYGSFGAVDPLTAQGRTVSAREVLDAAAKRIDTVRDPSVRIDVLRTIGELYFMVAVYEPAESLLLRARTEATALHGERSKERAEVLGIHASMLVDRGKYDEALVLAEETRSIGEDVPGAEGIARSALATIGSALEFKGDTAKAEEVFRQLLELDMRRFGARSKQVGEDLGHIGYNLVFKDRYEEAESMYKRAIETLVAVAPDADSTATAYHGLGLLYRRMARLPEAEQNHRRYYELRARLLGPDHPRVASALVELATDIQMQGRLDEAEPLLKRTLEIRERMLRPDHPELADTFAALAWLSFSRGQLASAIEYERRGRDIYSAALGARHPTTALMNSNLGRFQRDAGDYDAAERSLGDALAVRLETFGPEHTEVAITRVHLGTLRRLQGKLSLAETEYRQALAILEKKLPDDLPRIAEVRAGIGAVLVSSGRTDEALPLLQQASETLDSRVSGDDFRKAEAHLWFGMGLTRQGRPNEARPHLESAHEMLMRVRGAENRWTQLAAQEVAKLSR